MISSPCVEKKQRGLATHSDNAIGDPLALTRQLIANSVLAQVQQLTAALSYPLAAAADLKQQLSAAAFRAG